ncbi:hypothetical protein BO85DRAFT_272678 [Aspergillus piperis CBS 112811]|uniref:Uncharacterized protein n=1 Tax=Aspergillus piperis CBS 112811 TaxID=1448313 RepID=A0A8G1VM03_9EURO|nr:hypothetical protein BO85DRAFT_272678 [Aspergillus piperis CBS 112811]RAH58339.1 hypothetical protein BO85DRAFT_272678 [Aspergillus piperis CBS 112811]
MDGSWELLCLVASTFLQAVLMTCLIGRSRVHFIELHWIGLDWDIWRSYTPLKRVRRETEKISFRTESSRVGGEGNKKE